MKKAPKQPTQRTTTPHVVLKYDSVRTQLEANGWRPQHWHWKSTSEINSGTVHQIEWWNRGTDLLIVYRDEQRATVFTPATARRAARAIAQQIVAASCPDDDWHPEDK